MGCAEPAIVHLVRSSLRYVSYVNYKGRKTVAAAAPDLHCANADDALIELQRFDEEWSTAYNCLRGASEFNKSEERCSSSNSPEFRRRPVFTQPGAWHSQTEEELDIIYRHQNQHRVGPNQGPALELVQITGIQSPDD